MVPATGLLSVTVGNTIEKAPLVAVRGPCPLVVVRRIRAFVLAGNRNPVALPVVPFETPVTTC